MTITDLHTTPAPASAAVVAEFPLSTIQTQLWHLEQITPGDPSLNVAVRWEVRGTLSSASLERAFQHVIARHEILRTRFLARDGVPVQQVLADVPFKLALVDIRTLDAEDHPARIDEIARRRARQAFDLTKPCALRATLVRFSAERAILLIVAHHAVFDGFSIGVLGREIGTAAAAFEAGNSPRLPDLALQYGDFCLWQRDYLASGVLDDEARYWQQQMAGASYFEIETDHPRAARRSFRPGHVHHDLPAEFAPALVAAARAQAVSTFTYGAAVASAALHRMTGAPEVLFGTPVAGRGEVDLEPLIGAFISSGVLRIPTDGGAGFTAHLHRTRAVVEGALTHQNLPFSKLVELMNPPRDLSRTPLVSINFNQQHVFMEDRSYGDFDLVSRPSQMPGAARDIDIVLIERRSGWRLNIEYCAALYEPETMTQLAAQIAQAFDFAFANPGAELRKFPLNPALAARQMGADRGLRAIDEILIQHPGVSEAATLRTAAGAHAFVAASPDFLAPLDTLPPALMAFAAARLAPGDMPVGVSVLAQLPRDENGGIAHRLLPLPAPAPPPPRPAADDRDVVAALSNLWAEMLAVEAPPRDVSFFDLGGHSLLAVRLIARIRTAWALDIGVAAVYEHPTIASLAAYIRGQLAGPGDEPESPDSPDRQIEPITQTGPAQPIITINDIALTLATTRHLRQAHRATCIRLLAGPAASARQNRRFEDIAAEAASLVRRAQPNGPYLLFGVCVHGNIALEAARILHAEGEEIVGVVMKDVWEPGYVARMKARFNTRVREKFYALFNKIRMVRRGNLTLLAMLGSYRMIRATGLLQLAARLGLIDRVRQSDLAEEQEAFVAAISEARNVYRPAPVVFPVLHVITRISAQGRGFSPSLGWEDVVRGGLTTVNLDHVFVHQGREQGVETLAREIDMFLDGRSYAPAEFSVPAAAAPV